MKLSILAWTGPLVQFAMFVILVRRKLYLRGLLPFFSAYTLYSFLATIVRQIVFSHPRTYFVIFWSTEAIYSVLALLALNEVFRRLFEPDYEDHWWFRFLIPGTSLAVASVFLWVLLRNPLAVHISRIVGAVYGFDLGVHIVKVGILLLFLLLDKFFLSPKSRYDFGILAGFGISASFTIVSDVAGFYFGGAYESWFRYGPSIGYTLAVVVWLGAFLRRPDREKPDPQRVQQLLDSMRSQSEFLDRLLKGLGLRRAALGAGRFT